MKKYILYMALLAVAGCNEADFLNRRDPNHFTNDNFWRNKADAESALAAAYSPIKFQMSGYYGAFDGWLNLNSRGDDIFTITNEEQSMWDIANFANSLTTGNDPYGALFSGVQRANVVLRYIDTVPASGITEADRALIRGEALVLRAYQYFLLVTNYGRVPLRLLPSNEESPNKPAAEESQIWSRIEADLTTAIDDCGLPVNRAAHAKGRLELGAAKTVLAKVYAAQHKYEEARKVLRELIESSYGPGKRYQLMDNFADNFTTARENNAESVFELQYAGDGELSWGNEGGISMGSSMAQFVGPAVSGGWAKLMPSAFLVSEFMKEQRQDKGGERPDSKYDRRIYASLFFDPVEYGDWISPENGWYDGRFYGGIFTMQQLWDGNAAKMAGGAPVFTVSQSGSAKIGKFLLKKYTAWYVASRNADNMGNKEGKANNVRAIRFAEPLLLYAEACARTGDTPQANWALGEIRRRAGLPEITFPQAALMKEIEHQCLLEFFGEGHRFDDLKRWYNASQIRMILKANDKQGAANFSERYKFYPIPAGELSNNAAMTQNELWR